MRKKTLLTKNEELLTALNESKFKNEALKKRIDELNIVLGAKDFEICELKKQIESLNAKISDSAFNKEVTENQENKVEELVIKAEDNLADIEKEEKAFNNSESTNYEEDNTGEAKEDIKNSEEIKEPLNKQVLLSSDDIDNEIMSFAAKAISRISIKTASLSNLFAESKNPNAKDLLTLTLGKAEVFKQKVFEITKNNLDFEVAKASLNLLEAEIIEYYEQLKAQLN